MKKENLIWLLVGGAAVYFFLIRSKANAKPKIGIGDSAVSVHNGNLIEAKKKAAALKDNEISDLLTSYCFRGTRPPQELSNFKDAVRAEARKRNLPMPKCPDFGNYNPHGKRFKGSSNLIVPISSL